MSGPRKDTKVTDMAHATGRGALRTLRRVLYAGLFSALLMVSVPAGGVIAVLTFFGAAYLTSNVAGMSFLAATALLLVTGGLSSVAARYLMPRAPVARRLTPILLTAGGLVIATLSAAALVFEPHEVEYVEMTAAADTRYWELPTGSRLAYAVTPAKGRVTGVPVLMLHGGPGGPGPLAAQDEDILLAAAGHDVYRYHQIGAGLSERLADVSQYTVARHVDDLEAIRQKIGAEEMILVGGSWGGQLAAYYMAAHPARVAKAVFSSPGGLWRPSWQEGVDDPLPESEGPEVELINQAATPRFGVVYSLIQINPRAAHNLAPDDEMSAFFQRVLAPVIAGDIAACGEEQEAAYASPAGRIPSGFGFYANMVTSASLIQMADPRETLRALDTPVLILRGECDRLHARVHLEYAEVFPNATYLVVPDAGHSVASAALYPALIHAFLLGEELPLGDHRSPHY